jgi:TrmH family RNA methyltransferase
MLSNNRISFIRSLQQKKFREEHGLFIAEGDKLVKELLDSQFVVQQVCAVESWIQVNHKLVMKAESGEVVKPMDLEKMSSMTTPPEVMAVVEIPQYTLDSISTNSGLILMLDGIRDPGNMGTLIRTADWFGIRDIIATNDSVEFWNPKVVQATMGSISRVRLHNGNLDSVIGDLNKSVADSRGQLSVYGAAMEGKNVYQVKWSDSAVLIIGNESNGLRPETANLLSEKVTIPKSATSSAESLNAGIAAGILINEYYRNRLK